MKLAVGAKAENTICQQISLKDFLENTMLSFQKKPFQCTPKGVKCLLFSFLADLSINVSLRVW